MIQKISDLCDLDKIPSVLSSDELDSYMVELLEYIESNSKLTALQGATAINNLLGYLAYGEKGLSVQVSKRILNLIKKTYNSNDFELVDCLSANLANLTCAEARDYLVYLINVSTNDREKNELKGALEEIFVEEV